MNDGAGATRAGDGSGAHRHLVEGAHAVGCEPLSLHLLQIRCKHMASGKQSEHRQENLRIPTAVVERGADFLPKRTPDDD